MSKSIIIIAAVGPNMEIGGNGQLIYNLKSDMRHFKEITTGYTVVMGKKTFESLPKGALPNRHNIVISHDPTYTAANVTVATSIEDAIEKATTDKVFVIGGGQIYKLALPYASSMILSEIPVNKIIEADTFFPEFNKDSIQFPYVSSKFVEDESGIIYKISTYMKNVVG